MAVSFPNHFVLTVESGSLDGQTHWRNSFDIVGSVGNTPATNDPVVLAVIQWIADMQDPTSQVESASLRNWSYQAQPFSQRQAIWSILAINKVGNLPSWSSPYTPGPPCLGTVCSEIVKPVFAGVGKPGRVFLRNMFQRDNILSEPGGPPAFDPSFNQGVFLPALNAHTVTVLGPYCTNNPLPRLCLVHFSVKDYKANPATLPFDSAMAVPVFSRLTSNKLTRKNRK